MIKPTIGRVVLVNNPLTEQPCPAFICYVHSERLINAAGFDANGYPFRITSLQLLQEGDVPPPWAYAEWMPYQKGQAAKTEALEAIINKDTPMV